MGALGQVFHLRLRTLLAQQPLTDPEKGKLLREKSEEGDSSVQAVNHTDVVTHPDPDIDC